MPLTTVESRRPIRRKASESRQTRLKHIRVAYRLLSGSATAETIARQQRVSRATVYRWLDLALTYPDAEAEGLRLMFDRDRG